MSKPITTRLRFVSARDPKKIVSFLDNLGARVQLYGNPIWDGKKWFCWFVPGDLGPDIQVTEL